MATARQRATGPGRTWQQTKSELTRSAILDATLECMHQHGYAGTTTERVVRAAGVSRGAMLHHFPSRQDLLAHAIEHLMEQRRDAWASRLASVTGGSLDARRQGVVEAYREQLASWQQVVTLELQLAARTDEDLLAALAPALADHDRAALRAVRDLFPEIADERRFARALHYGRHLLDGLALEGIVHGARDGDHEEDVIALLEEQLAALLDAGS